jgi:RecA-family ATPase
LPFNDPLADFKLEQHLENLKRAIAYHKPDLVVIDSLRGSHGREENDSKAMQSVMSRLVSLAKEFDVAVLVTHHTNKPAPGQPDLVDLHRVRGSTAITANCRMIWGLERPDPQDETVRLKVVKSNLASFPKPLGLIITDEEIEWTKAPVTPEECNLERVRETKEDAAAGWLRDFLKDGPKPSREVQSEGEEASHRWATLRRAADRPGLITKLAPDKEHNFWRWALDAHSSQSNKDEQVNNYEQVEHV